MKLKDIIKYIDYPSKITLYVNDEKEIREDVRKIPWTYLDYKLDTDCSITVYEDELCIYLIK